MRRHDTHESRYHDHLIQTLIIVDGADKTEVPLGDYWTLECINWQTNGENATYAVGTAPDKPMAVIRVDINTQQVLR